MKKFYLILFMAFFVLIGCNESPKNKKQENPEENAGVQIERLLPEVTEREALAKEHYPELYGIYSGDFMIPENDEEINYSRVEYGDYNKKISLKFNRIINDTVYGHSITGGNQRPFVGTYDKTSNVFILNEPGDDKTDGKFELQLKNDSIVGVWRVYQKKNVRIPKKELRLQRKVFAYDPNLMLDRDTDLIDWSSPKEFIDSFVDSDTEEGEEENYSDVGYRVASELIFEINASTQKLTEKDLKNLKKLDLEIIRNSVYARHGYSFKKATYRYFFEMTDWYIPVSDNVDDQLSVLEKENIVLLNRMIKYAEDHYDTFGR